MHLSCLSRAIASSVWQFTTVVRPVVELGAGASDDGLWRQSGHAVGSSLQAGNRRPYLRHIITALAIVTVATSAVVHLCSDALAEDWLPSSKGDVPPNGADPFAGFVSEASQRFNVPERWIRAVIRVESHANLHATSPKGALGLMQIMPKTWNEIRAKFALGDDPYDPRDNILAGTAYLREMHDRFGSAGFLAAYNAGPARYADHLATGRPLPPETDLYLAKLAPIAAGAKSNTTSVAAHDDQAWTNAPLFVTHAESGLIDRSGADNERPDHRLMATPTGSQPPVDRIFIPASR